MLTVLCAMAVIAVRLRHGPTSDPTDARGAGSTNAAGV